MRLTRPTGWLLLAPALLLTGVLLIGLGHMLELSLQMHAVVFSPSDIAPPGYMFIIQRGVALYQGKVMTKGKVFGEDMILQDESLRSKAAARAMTWWFFRPGGTFLDNDNLCKSYNHTLK